MENTHYYLVNSKLMKGGLMPLKISMLYRRWHSSLQPCDIEQSELDKIMKTFGEIYTTNPLNVTELVDEKHINQDCAMRAKTIYKFKAPKQVDSEENEEDIWMEISNRIYKDSNEWKKIMKEFTITRKQLNPK